MVPFPFRNAHYTFSMIEFGGRWKDGADRWMLKPLPYHDVPTAEARREQAAQYLSRWCDAVYLAKYADLTTLPHSFSGPLPSTWVGGISGIYDVPVVVWLAPVKRAR